LYDHSEETFLAVLRPDGSLLSGHPWLRASTGSKAFEFSNIQHNGRNLRTVSLVRTAPAPFTVVMAQTTQSRSALLQRLLELSIAPQAALLLLLAWWIRRAISFDIQPIVAMEAALHQRDAHDLSPLSVNANTRDLYNLARATNALIQRIQAGITAQREFTGNVAHELRTPLAGIRAQADYALRRDVPEIWRQQLIGIVASQDRASHMIDQLLAMALADENSDGIALVPIALDQLVQQAILQALPRADAQHVDLGAFGIDDPVMVLGNAALLEGVLGNLIDNALRYGKSEQEKTPKITVCLSLEAQHVRLSVSDNGPGIAQSEITRLVGRWQRGSSRLLAQPQTAGIRTSTGLGLAIVSRYASLLQSTLEFDCAPPSGTTVSLLLRKAPPME
jgi:two-component system, OmpR family, sensor histidine kinase TctE